MPALQTSYTSTIPVAVPGHIADMRPRTVLSYINQSPNNMGFGVVAVFGTIDNGVLNVGDIGAGAYRGITVLDPAVRPQFNNAYGPTDTVGVMTRGAIWVQVSAAVAAGAAAYYTAAGVITSSASGNTAIPNAIFETSTTGAGLARLRL